MKSRSLGPRVAAGLLALLVCSGCFPMNVTKSPGVTGVVVDAGTGSPVAGAEVLVSKATSATAAEAGGASTAAPSPPPLSTVLAAARRPTVTTGADGRFTVPPERRWIMTLGGALPPPPSGTVVVRRAGYATTLREVTGRKEEIGSIPLTPEP
jgi:hypothetical protein